MPVRLGHQAEGSIAPALFALVERGAARSPRAARQLGGHVELRFEEGYPSITVVPEGEGLLVDDVQPEIGAPGLVVSGPLPALLSLATAPRTAGLPSLGDRRGRKGIPRRERSKSKTRSTRKTFYENASRTAHRTGD